MPSAKATRRYCHRRNQENIPFYTKRSLKHKSPLSVEIPKFAEKSYAEYFSIVKTAKTGERENTKAIESIIGQQKWERKEAAVLTCSPWTTLGLGKANHIPQTQAQLDTEALCKGRNRSTQGRQLNYRTIETTSVCRDGVSATYRRKPHGHSDSASIFSST